MKIRSKATLTLRAMLARRYGFGASPNKKQRSLFWNLRFSGFLNALGCGFYYNKLFFIHRI